MRINHTGRLALPIINSIKQYHYGTEHHNINHIGHPCPPYGLNCRYRITRNSYGKNALTGLKTARNWLQAQHSFYGKDGDPIQCTGWQFIGYNFIAAVVVALLLCIEHPLRY